MADKDIYDGQGREELLDDDELSPTEEGFMEGASDDGQGAKCRKCGNGLIDCVVERRVGKELLRFCSNNCAEKYTKGKIRR